MGLRFTFRFIPLVFILFFRYTKNLEIKIETNETDKLNFKHVKYLKTTGIFHPKEKNLVEKLTYIRKYDEETTLCSEINFDKIECNFTDNCTWGIQTNVSCWVKEYRHKNSSENDTDFSYSETEEEEIECKGDRNFTKIFDCKYCWQLPPEDANCRILKKCVSGLTWYRTRCYVKSNVLCIGNRVFSKNRMCSFQSGRFWLAALVMSVFVGALGVDRCYMGYIGWGFLKAFSCGGLCIWALLDVILIATFLLGPQDGGLWYS